jgi:hypothetical protein
MSGSRVSPSAHLVAGYDHGVKSESEPRQSQIRRVAATVYDAQGGSRSPVLDGPWWLGLIGVVVVAVLVLDSEPWKWLVVPIAAAFFWLPFYVRWVLALSRSVRAFREGFRP